MDIRIEDSPEDIAREERRIQDRRVREQTAQVFKQAMVGAQARGQLVPKEKELNRDKTKEKDVKVKADPRDGKKAENKDEHIRLDSILGAFRGEDNAKTEERFITKRVTQRISAEEESERQSESKEATSDAQTADDSTHALKEAVVGGFGGSGHGDMSGGASSQGDNSEDERQRREAMDSDSIDGRGSKKSSAAIAASDHQALPVERADRVFSLRLQTRLSRKIPQSLLNQIITKCHVVLDGVDDVVELSLSRFLFDGMKIRISRLDASEGAVCPLKIELLTRSEEVAQFFRAEMPLFVAELEKRGLAVTPNSVMVVLQ